MSDPSADPDEAEARSAAEHAARADAENLFPLAELDSLTDEDIARRFNWCSGPDTGVDAGFWLEELERRAAREQGRRVERLTAEMRDMTDQMVWLTALAGFVAALAVVVSVIVAVWGESETAVAGLIFVGAVLGIACVSVGVRAVLVRHGPRQREEP